MSTVLAVALLVKVLITILTEYRFYFPPSFDAAFLSGRRDSFVGVYRAAFYGHLISGPVAIALGTCLLFTGNRPRLQTYHRYAGRCLLVIVVVLLAPTGLVMAAHSHAGPAATYGFSTLAIATAISLSVSGWQASKRRWQVHRRWAVRSWLLLCSPLLFRLFTGAAIVLQWESLDFYRLNAWVSWLLPLGLYEVFWRLRERTSCRLLTLGTGRCYTMMMRDVGSTFRFRPRGFTLLELVVVLIIIGALIALLLPATRSSREAARRMSCSNNLKQIGLAFRNYHDIAGHLPAAMAGTGNGLSDGEGNANRLSGLVALLPYLEQQALWEQISNPMTVDSVHFPAMGPAPWIENYPPWSTELSVFRCASDGGRQTDLGRKNYAFCIGDAAREIHEPTHVRGVFACRTATRLQDVSDGESNTIAMAEIGTSIDRVTIGHYAIGRTTEVLDKPSICLSVVDLLRSQSYLPKVPLGSPGRGGSWADGAAGIGLFNTILPPNSPSCAVGNNAAVDGLYSAGSHHYGGANVLMADSGVRFISQSIDSGNLGQAVLTDDQLATPPAPSPYGIWGALGTATGEDSLEGL